MFGYMFYNSELITFQLFFDVNSHEKNMFFASIWMSLIKFIIFVFYLASR